MKEILELETQKKIYSLISRQPGLNLSKIAEIIQISVQLAQYHLRYLEKHGLISSEREEGYLRYYLAGEIGAKDKKFLALFRQEMSLKIILYIINNPYSRHKDIMSYFNLSRSLLTYYLKKLIKKGYIGFVEKADKKGYVVVNESEIIRFIIKYEPYKILKGIDETWVDFSFK